MQQRSGDGIFYGYHTYHRGIVLDFPEYFFESGTTYQLYLLAFEVLVGGYIVERTNVPLYCHSLHKRLFL